MKKLKLNITRVLVAMLVLTSFVACDEVGDTDPGGTSVEALAGDWFMNLSAPDGTPISEHDLFSTYNTAANDGGLWLDDHDAVGKFKVKVMSAKDGSFKATTAANEYNTRTVNITDGKVEKNAATSKGGHKVDKISFKAEFSDEPGVIYSYEGHRRTGFFEDEY
ncbi:lipid-binding protein [Flavobacterium olei]|uniref:lipid-binding protein n=1 Tax=Flavobacterium olei TaxID=1886782 RepID=UPI0032192759